MRKLLDIIRASEDIQRQAYRGVAEHFASVDVATVSGIWDVTSLDGMVVIDDDKCAGAIFWRDDGVEREIVSLHASPKWAGAGRLLIEAIIERSKLEHVSRLWLVTTNDNIDALRFYQRRGFRLSRIYSGTIDEVRNLKPEIPLAGAYGIEIHDDIELEMNL